LTSNPPPPELLSQNEAGDDAVDWTVLQRPGWSIRSKLPDRCWRFRFFYGTSKIYASRVKSSSHEPHYRLYTY